MTIRKDIKTGKYYDVMNVEIKRKGRLSAIESDRGYFKIENELGPIHSGRAWKDGIFLGDRYAVFKWINETPRTGHYERVSKYYKRYGYAVRIMGMLAK